jgi:hypothetical protein
MIARAAVIIIIIIAAQPAVPVVSACNKNCRLSSVSITREQCYRVTLMRDQTAPVF